METRKVGRFLISGVCAMSATVGINFYVPTAAISTVLCFGTWHILLWKTFVLLGAMYNNNNNKSQKYLFEKIAADHSASDLSAEEHFVTETTAKLFDVRVHQLMLSQFCWCIETLWTFIAYVRLHTFVTPQVCLKVTFAAKLFLTNVTREPSSFIVCHQQM